MINLSKEQIEDMMTFTLLNPYDDEENLTAVIKVNDLMQHYEEKPQGEWINHRNDYGHNIADCSLCGKAMQWHDEDEDGTPRYCWYCGAKMKGVKNNANRHGSMDQG